MLAANGLVQTILSNRAETKRKISWANMERSSYKVHSVPKQYRPEKDSELGPKIKKGAFISVLVNILQKLPNGKMRVVLD